MTAIELLGGLIISTLVLMSFSLLYRHNAFFRIAENITVGGLVSYATILSLRQVWKGGVVPALGGNLLLAASVIFGLLIYLSLSNDRNLRFVGRLPVMVIVGVGLGTSLRSMIQTQLIAQIASTIQPLFSGDIVTIISNIIIFVGTITTIMYFYYTREQTGILKNSASIARLIIMVAFGATYGNAFQGRFTSVIGPLTYVVTSPGYYVLPIALVILAYGIWQNTKKNKN